MLIQDPRVDINIFNRGRFWEANEIQDKETRD